MLVVCGEEQKERCNGGRQCVIYVHVDGLHRPVEILQDPSDASGSSEEARVSR